MPDPDYTAWPIAADITAQLSTVGISLRVTGDAATARLQLAIDDVTAEVAKLTLRQWIADTDVDDPVTRYYDGKGTAVLEVDEFVQFLGCAAIGLNADPGYPLANVIPYAELGKPQTKLIRGQGGLPAFQVAAVYQPIPTIFPTGRQNISVQCLWGYGAAIPADLWFAVCCEMARRVGNEAIFDPSGGMIVKWEEGDEKGTYAAGGLDGLGWNKGYQRKLEEYRRRPGRRMRGLRAPMT